jgi:hypothetical protein
MTKDDALMKGIEIERIVRAVSWGRTATIDQPLVLSDAEAAEHIAAAILAADKAGYDRGFNAGLESAAKRADDEPVPEGPMPDEFHLVPLADALQAAVIATKRAIADAVRALKLPETPT